MRYRNIKINYDGLKYILGEIETYKRAVKQLIDSMQMIHATLISENDTKSVLEMESLYLVTKKQLQECYDEADALYKLLDDYTEEMSALIGAKKGMTQVNRNDIYWNLQSMYAIIDDIQSVEIANPIPEEDGTGKTDTQIQAMQRNYRKITYDIWCVLFPSIYTNILTCKKNLRKYYDEKIVEYEDTDDEYRKKAKQIREKYASNHELNEQRACDIADGVINTLKGAVMTVVELGKAWFTLKDISYMSQLERAAVITALLPSGQPKWAKELSGNELAPYYLLYALIKEPVELVERIGQSANDAYDKNGLTYYIGTTIADVLMGVGVSKALKTAKAGTVADDVVKLADNVVDIADDAMKVLDDVIPYADDAIETLDDIAQYPDEVIDNLDEALDAVDETAEVAGKGGKNTGTLTIIDGHYSASEINAAQYVADLGNDVVLRPPVGTRADGQTSDLLVNGINYDVYTPKTNNPSAIIRAITKKNTQTTGVVLDLSGTTVTADDLENVLARVKGAIETNGGTCNINDIIIMPK